MKIIKTAAQKIKNMLRNTINNQKGVVLPIVLMAIGGLSLLGAAAISVSSGEMSIAHNDRHYKTAFNLAEAGINDAVDAIGGNRDLMPRPLGAITTASYSFSVGGTAFNDTGRYNVIVTIPIVTTVTGDIALNASTVVVQSTAGLTVGNTIIVGDANTHCVTTIGAIDTTNRILTLTDAQGRYYSFKTAFSANNAWVALNLLRVTATGEAGPGLAGTGIAPSTIGGWRNVLNINSSPNPTIPAAATGAIRSTVKLQGDYSVQEIGLFGTYDAGVINPGNRFYGPMLITQGGQLTVAPYTKGDYSGPIFDATGSANAINFYGQTDSQGKFIAASLLTAPTIPTIIKVPTSKIDINALLAAAASNSQCYQLACNNASATQQIYFVNGYQIDVYTSSTPNKPPATVSSDITTLTNLSTQYIDTSVSALPQTVRVFMTASTSVPGGGISFKLYLDGINPGNVLAITNNSGTPGVSVAPDTITITPAAAGNSFWVDVTIPAGTLANSTHYINGKTTGGSPQTFNAVFLTLGPLTINSQERQGDTTLGTHTNHTLVRTTANGDLLPRQVNKIYTANDAIYSPGVSSWSTIDDAKAVLFNGMNMQDMYTGSNKLSPGERTEYNTMYFIHTDDPGCNPADIKIVSHTIVTYIGTRKDPCDISKTLMLFQYETIWNHTAGNTLSSGPQADDADSQGTLHKGYYKWIKTKDVANSDLDTSYLKPEPLFGDREFNSVFNHSAKSNFSSAIVNWNIKKVRMIGWSNPPTVFSGPQNSATMQVSPTPWPTANWTDALSSVPNIDNDDISREYSAFMRSGILNGFDFSGIDPTTYDDSAGYRYLLDSSTLHPSLNNIMLYRTPVTTSNIYASGVWSKSTSPGPTAASPFMPSVAAPPFTVITATNSGPLTAFEIKRGVANLFFNAANGIPFNLDELKIETKSTGTAQIMIGSAANPASVYVNKFELKTESCGSQVNFSFIGKMVAGEVEMKNNVTYNWDTTRGGGNTCLSSGIPSYIYLRKQSWKELR